MLGSVAESCANPPGELMVLSTQLNSSLRVGPGERSLHKCIWKLRSHLVLNVQGYHRVDLHLIWQFFIKCGQILYYATHCHADSERGNACHPVHEMRERAVRI